MNASLQTKNSDVTSMNLMQFDFENGHGKMVYGYQQECTNEELLEAGDCWDNNNRNIVYKNNVWLDTPELLDLYGYEGADGWCWNLLNSEGNDSTDNNGNVVSLCDTIIAGQSKWVGDSTIAQFANGISENNNINDANIGLDLGAPYIERYIARSLNWIEVQSGLTDWSDFSDYSWMHQSLSLIHI